MSKREKYQELRSTVHIPLYRELMGLRPTIPDSEGSYIERKENFKIPNDVKLDSGMAEFYQFGESWSMKWGSWIDSDKDVTGLEGSFNFMPIEIMMKADVGLDPEEFPAIRNFTILDYYLDENAVGFYLDQPEKGLFFYEMDADPRALRLNFDGYIEMLKYSRGFLHWQLSALTLANGGIIEDTEKFEKLNGLFPDLTLDGFVTLYESLRIDK